MGSYVIAGGTKGIGAAITRLLLSEGHTVTILARESSNDPTLQAAEFVAWDAREGVLPALTLDRIDGAVYCPGAILQKPFHRFTVDEYMEDWQINALGAALFLQALH